MPVQLTLDLTPQPLNALEQHRAYVASLASPRDYDPRYSVIPF